MMLANSRSKKFTVSRMLGQVVGHVIVRFLLLITLPTVILPPARAELYPIRKYNTSDGLAQNFINRILFDRRGFAWIGTNEGFSRFDGYRFVSYGVELGLPHRQIRDIIESGDGRFWLATNGGLVHFNPQGAPKGRFSGLPPMFTYYRLPGEAQESPVTSLVKGADGLVWCGTGSGLFKLTNRNGGYALEPTSFVTTGGDQRYIRSMLAHEDGSLWIGLSNGIVVYHPEREPGQAFESFGEREGLPDMEISRLTLDRSRRIWIGTGRGLFAQTVNPAVSKLNIKDRFHFIEGLPGDWVRDLYQAEDGTYWVATDRGLTTFRLKSDGQATDVRKYLIENGLSDYYLTTITTGPQGSIWIGTANAGIMKWVTDGFTSYGMADRIASAVSIFSTLNGQTTVAAYVNEIPPGVPGALNLQLRLGQLENGRFFWVRPNIPAGGSFSSGWNQVGFQDRQGEWWIPTTNGIYRFPRGNSIRHLQTARPIGVYNRRHGLSLDWVTRLFEDSRGDIWIATSQKNIHHLDRWERATNRIVNVSKGDNQSIFQNRQVTALAEDRYGVVWLGLSHDTGMGGLARLLNGRLILVDEEPDAPRGNLHCLFFDQAGRLWAGSTIQGLIRINDPQADRLVFRYYGKEQGLISNRVTSITADNLGRIYAGTARGLDQLDLQSDRIRHFSQFEGLALGSVDDLFRDGNGAIWAATTQGISTFTPGGTTASVPPAVFVDRLRIGGREFHVSAFGESEVTIPEIEQGNNQIEIQYLGLTFAIGDNLRYQIRLDGVDQDWVDRGDVRTLNYANLGPGRYRLLIRAINAEGTPSSSPAVVNFSIAPPFWLSWWFVLLLLLVTFFIGYLIHWTRFRQQLRLERLRTQISSDLHDEVGSSLSQIAILTEVALRQTESGSPTADQTRDLYLRRVAEISRAAIDSMEEIVWLVNPHRDSLTDLAKRIRHFAGESLAARGDIELNFAASEGDFPLDVPKRRHIYLFFKEAINNIVRHSQATRVKIEITVTGSELLLRISDNGVGFQMAQLRHQGYGGNGLNGLRNRAAELCGTISIESSPGNGTHISLIIPLN